VAFCFKKKESIAKAIRRLTCERVENALECLEDCGHAEAIHCARKDIKKVRAVLRLVQTEIVKKEFRRLTSLLRKAANLLAVPRDAYIKAKTLRDLARHFKGQLAPGALRGIRAELRNAFDEEMKRFGREKTGRRVERILRRVAKQLERLDVNGKGWKALSPGVRAAYSQGRCAYQRVLKDSSPGNLHDWRKSVKDLWYQVTLLRPVWPEQMDAIAGELESLGECLGDDHDLVVLQHAVEKLCKGDRNARELEILNGLTEQRHRELRDAAGALGARFYAEKPSMFCNRLARYWRTWRHEKEFVARAADTT